MSMPVVAWAAVIEGSILQTTWYEGNVVPWRQRGWVVVPLVREVDAKAEIERLQAELKAWQYSAKYDDVHFAAIKERAEKAEAEIERLRADAEQPTAAAVREACAVAAWSEGMKAHAKANGLPVDARECGSYCAAAIRALDLSKIRERQGVLREARWHVQYRDDEGAGAMSDEDIARGCDIAFNALMFAVFNNGQGTAGECRRAIVTLFGAEVDTALEKRITQWKEQER